MATVDPGDFFQQDGSWYVDANGVEYRVCDDVEVHIYSAGTWLSGEAGLLNVLADGDDLALYTDRSATSGGQIRIIRATMSD